MLNGLRVVDCSTGIAGPYCTKLLADAGADVVKVEPAAGDPMRGWRSGALFEFLNTSKRSVTATQDDESVAALCDQADIVIESGPPGTFQVDALRERNPALVVTSITPFGQDGPWASWAATEFTLQAWCGSTGSRGVAERPPVSAGGRIGEWVTGTYAAVASLAAQRAAAQSGIGERIDVAWLDCMAVSMNTYTSVFAEFTGWAEMRRPTRTVEIPSIEPTSDGFAAFTTNSAQQWEAFLVLLGRPDLAEDRDLANALGRYKRRHDGWKMIHAYTTQHTTAELLEQATLLRIPCGPAGNGATVTTFDHFIDQGTFVPAPSGRFVQPRVPYRISGLSSRPFEASPSLGEHTGTIDWPTRVAAAASAPQVLPLTGVRVLDCTAWWAGPAATHMLACLGADVIKIESITRPDLMRYTTTRPPTEDHWWDWAPLFHGANNGKRAITVDLTRPDGRDLFLRLVETADVVLENFSPRVMEHFDLDWPVIHAANPRTIMVRLPAYGLAGPWRDRTGFAQTMEAITGMAWITGWPDAPPILPRGACDPLAAMHAVFSTLLALHDRDTSGEGRLVEVTMIEAALNMAAEQVVEYGASGTLLVREGNRGPLAAPQNVYQCAGDEEWIAIAVVTDDQWVALRRVLDDPGWAVTPALATADGRRAAHDMIDRELSTWCQRQDARPLAERLASTGVPAGYVIDGRDVSKNAQLNHRGLFEVEDHPITGAHPVPIVPFRFAGRAGQGWMRRPAPMIGEHNDEVLRELLGLSDVELAEMRDNGLLGDRPVGT